MEDAADKRTQTGPERGTRRSFLFKSAQWAIIAAGMILLYPLRKFASFRVPPKPRLIEVPAPLPLSGVHIGHDFILFASPDGPTAVSRICTHLGCRVNYQQDKEYIECPCHQSRFTPTGKRIAGPAQKNLPSYAVNVKKDGEGRIVSYVVQL